MEFFYIAGHRLSGIRPDATVPQYFRKLIKPPKFIYLICASPQSKKYPIGVMVTGGLAAQILGIGSAIYALAFLVKPTAMDELGMTKIILQVIGLIFVMIVSYAIPYLFVKKSPYNE